MVFPVVALGFAFDDFKKGCKIPIAWPLVKNGCIIQQNISFQNFEIFFFSRFLSSRFRSSLVQMFG
jgi:hypothetical protein